MFNLIRNELKKVFKKKLIYISLLIIIALNILLGIAGKKFEKENSGFYGSHRTPDVTLKEQREDYLNLNIKEFNNKNEFEGAREGIRSDISRTYNLYLIYYLQKETRLKLGEEVVDQFIGNEYTDFDFLKETDSKLVDKFIKTGNIELPSMMDTVIKKINSTSDTDIIKSLQVKYKKDEFANNFFNDLLKYKVSLKDKEKINKVLFVNHKKSFIKNTESTIKDLEKNNKNKGEKYESLKRDYKIDKNKYEIGLYELEHNLTEVGKARGYLGADLFKNMLNIIIILIIVFSASIIVDEFKDGTIKNLFISPYSRNKILLSKILSLVIILLFILLVSVLSNMLVTKFIMKANLNAEFLYYNIPRDKIIHSSYYKYILYSLVSFLPEFIFYILFTVLISILSISTPATIIVAFISHVFKDVFATIFTMAKLYYFKRLYMFNLNFQRFLLKSSEFNFESKKFEVALNEQIITYSIYVVVIIVLSFILFNKKEVHNK